jgi:hypothetical protein
VIPEQSVCIYHNGNSRVLEQYKQKFSHLKFSGNLTNTVVYPDRGQMWEICFADATRENLAHAKKSGVHILLHISSYEDDQHHLLPESSKFEYNRWLNFAVSNNLSFANEIVSDFVYESMTTDSIVIVTTGRTANTYFQEILAKSGIVSFEHSRFLTNDFLSSSSAILFWRLDQWECLSSKWIADRTHYKYSHQIGQAAHQDFDFIVPEISQEWIETDWVNMCCLVLDHALLYKYVLQRPIYSATTEHIVSLGIETQQQKITYDKSKIIPDYEKSRLLYEQSEIAEILTMLYNQTQLHIKELDYEKTLLHGIRAV